MAVSTKARQALERRVVRAACEELIAQGCAISLSYGEGDYGVVKAVTADAVLNAMHACDEEWLIVWQRNPDGYTRLGSVYLVYGNDGYDVIADLTVVVDEMLPNTNALIDKLGANA